MKQSEVLVISSYPNQGSTHAAKTVGAASYTKTLLVNLQNALPETNITVLAEVLDQAETYTESNINVVRLWKRNSLSSILDLTRTILTHSSNTIVVSFEAYMFGNPAATFLFLQGLMLAKIKGKKVIFLLHQAPGTFEGLEESNLKKPVLTLAKNVLFKAISLASNTVVVFEDKLKLNFSDQKKVTVISHFVPEVKILAKAAARRQLGWDKNQTYILYFGYLAPYKGVDWLVENWPESSNKKLVIAGGINPNHSHTPSVQQFVEKVETTAQQKNIQVTGFVKEADIQLYFSACDAVILPYQNFMSSSGPLSFAVAYQQPVLLSKPLAAYGESSDVKAALSASGLSIDDLVFDFTELSLQSNLDHLDSIKKRCLHFAQKLSELRSTDTISTQLADIIEKE